MSKFVKVGCTHSVEHDIGYLGLRVHFEPWVPAATIVKVVNDIGNNEFGIGNYCTHFDHTLDTVVVDVNAI